MDIHVNAKTTLKMRQLILRRAAAGWAYRQIAAALDISDVVGLVDSARDPS